MDDFLERFIRVGFKQTGFVCVGNYGGWWKDKVGLTKDKMPILTKRCDNWMWQAQLNGGYQKYKCFVLYLLMYQEVHMN